MTQTVPATCVLGPGKTGLTIGLRVLNLDGTTYAAFATTNVAETSIAGTYRKAGGVVVPAAGGYIVWGTALVDYAEATVESTAVNVTHSAGIATGGRLAEVTDLPAAAPSAATVADAVWDEALSGHAAAGSTGARLGTTALEATAQAILEDTGTTLPTAIAVVDANVDLLLAMDTSTTDATTAGAISRRRGNSWSIPLTIGAITGYTSLWLTIKHSRGGPDSDAILQVKLNASGVGDGLLYVNGTPASDSTKAAITVNNAATGAITITVHEVITAALPVGEFAYDIQTLVSGVVATPDSGAFTVTADVTRSIV